MSKPRKPKTAAPEQPLLLDLPESIARQIEQADALDARSTGQIAATERAYDAIMCAEAKAKLAEAQEAAERDLYVHAMLATRLGVEAPLGDDAVEALDALLAKVDAAERLAAEIMPEVREGHRLDYIRELREQVAMLTGRTVARCETCRVFVESGRPMTAEDRCASGHALTLSEDWRARALAAEQRAELAEAALAAMQHDIRVRQAHALAQETVEQEAEIARLRQGYRVSARDVERLRVTEAQCIAWLIAHGWEPGHVAYGTRQQWRRVDQDTGLGIAHTGSSISGVCWIDLTVREVAEHHRLPELDVLEQIAATTSEGP